MVRALAPDSRITSFNASPQDLKRRNILRINMSDEKLLDARARAPARVTECNLDTKNRFFQYFMRNY
jgi:hypothetical protein